MPGLLNPTGRGLLFGGVATEETRYPGGRVVRRSVPMPPTGPYDGLLLGASGPFDTRLRIPGPFDPIRRITGVEFPPVMRQPDRPAHNVPQVPRQVREGYCRPEDVHLTGIAPGVDWDFVIGREGCRTAGYVPPRGPRSGVTIGRGFDMGQHNAGDLQALGLPQDIVTTLTPYLGRRGQDALRYREEHPLQMTQAQVDLIDRQVMNQTYDHVATAFNRASTDGRRFQDLPRETQTAIMDLAHQYGTDLANAAPNAWRFATNGQWNELHNELMHFGDQYGPRREAEARLVQSAIDNGSLRDAPPRNGARPAEQRPIRR